MSNYVYVEYIWKRFCRKPWNCLSSWTFDFHKPGGYSVSTAVDTGATWMNQTGKTNSHCQGATNTLYYDSISWKIQKYRLYLRGQYHDTSYFIHIPLHIGASWMFVDVQCTYVLSSKMFCKQNGDKHFLTPILTHLPFGGKIWRWPSISGRNNELLCLFPCIRRMRMSLMEFAKKL